METILSSGGMNFFAFDVGNSSQDEVAVVAKWMSDFGYTSNGTYDNADGTVSTATIIDVARNSDVVYINGHGGEYANIQVRNSNGNITSYLCADASVNPGDTITKYGIGARWKTGSTTKTTSYWNNGTKWVILAPCSQLNYNGVQGTHWNGLTSAEVWARTRLGDGQRIHGYVGYYNTAPGGSTHTSRLENFFGYCMHNNSQIVDAWAQAHTFLIGSSDWAAIYHSANMDDRFQSMSATTANGSAYEIYYVGRNISEHEIDIASASDFATTEGIMEGQDCLPQFNNIATKNFSAEATRSALKNKLKLSDNSIFEVENNGRITYSVGERNWGDHNLNYELTDSEAILAAEQELDKLGLLPQDSYRTVVSRIERIKLDLSGEQENVQETVEYTVSFYRTHNGIDVLSDQEDGIIVGFNKDGLTELRYMWRNLSVVASDALGTSKKITFQQAQEACQTALVRGEQIKTTRDAEGISKSFFVTTAYLQIDNAVKPVWAFSTDNSYANCIFVDMYTGNVLNVV
ncbi:MAG: hypothetical protein IJ338_00105 [Bacteroidaceae bacterium]|nr:hypothetical protein [Bacteroidaceae bacterium]